MFQAWFKVSLLTVAGFFPFMLGFSQLTNGYNSKQFVMIQREQTKIHGAWRTLLEEQLHDLKVSSASLWLNCFSWWKACMFGIKKFLGKNMSDLLHSWSDLWFFRQNKSDGPAVIVLIFEPCVVNGVLHSKMFKI